MRKLAIAVVGLAVAAAAPAPTKSADSYLIGCGRLDGDVLKRCESMSDDFRADYAKAMQGDYDGLMNAARPPIDSAKARELIPLEVDEVIELAAAMPKK